MKTAGTLDLGRDLFVRGNWGDAYTQLSAADGESPLPADDLEKLAVAAVLVGKENESAEYWIRAYHGHLASDDGERAARCAFWLGMRLMSNGDMARGGGWLARAEQYANERGNESVLRGYLMVPAGLGLMAQSDNAGAADAFARALEIGARFGDPDLLTLSRLGRGQALTRLGDIAGGVTLLDEVMVAVTAREVNPVVTGIAYCAVIDACQAIFDVRRTQEWTQALSDWCASHPDLVPFKGQCLVHRAQIMQMRGAWNDAIEEARRARDWLENPPGPAIGAAFYQLGEIHRLRGEFAEAEAAYRDANQWGRDPQPGLSQLRLAQGRVDGAATSIARAIADATDFATRAKLLPAHTEIMIAAGDLQSARRSSDELTAITREVNAPLLEAISEHARGAVLLAEGKAGEALRSLRAACSAWQGLDNPYENARARVLIGLACRALGDSDAAEMELDAARRVFVRLGAGPDVARLDDLGRPAAAAGGLTGREIEVLRLVAEGKTNRGIAEALVISEKTVARHVANIFTKLDVSTRAEATAYAFKNDLV